MKTLPLPGYSRVIPALFLLAGLLSVFALRGQTTAPAQADKGIVFFEGDWNAVKAEAARTGKPIFVDAYATWCGPCKMLAKNVFTVPEVGSLFNGSFINWHIDMETPEGEAFGAAFPVEAYPTLFFFDKEGNQLKKKTGYRDAKELMTLAGFVLHPESDTLLRSWNNRFNKGERSRSFLYAYMYTLAKNDEPYNDVLALIGNSLTEKELENDTAFLVFCMHDIAFDSELGKYFCDHYAQFEKRDAEMSQEKAKKFLNTGFNEILEKKDKKRLDELKKFAGAIWKDQELADLLKAMDEEYEKSVKNGS
ncbi:MAG: putative disulfide-isomerase [Bacteroidetes bacterium]|nr:MAG: putative disulfide-isomerase [Bacteroidota bacterium]